MRYQSDNKSTGVIGFAGTVFIFSFKEGIFKAVYMSYFHFAL